MEHAGFDQLNTPQGVLIVFASLLIVTGIIIGGAFLFRANQVRDSEQRAEMRRLHEQKKNEPPRS